MGIQVRTVYPSANPSGVSQGFRSGYGASQDMGRREERAKRQREDESMDRMRLLAEREERLREQHESQAAIDALQSEMEAIMSISAPRRSDGSAEAQAYRPRDGYQLSDSLAQQYKTLYQLADSMDPRDVEKRRAYLDAQLKVERQGHKQRMAAEMVRTAAANGLFADRVENFEMAAALADAAESGVLDADEVVRMVLKEANAESDLAAIREEHQAALSDMLGHLENTPPLARREAAAFAHTFSKFEDMDAATSLGVFHQKLGEGYKRIGAANGFGDGLIAQKMQRLMEDDGHYDDVLPQRGAQLPEPGTPEAADIVKAGARAAARGELDAFLRQYGYDGARNADGTPNEDVPEWLLPAIARMLQVRPGTPNPEGFNETDGIMRYTPQKVPDGVMPAKIRSEPGKPID